MPDILHPYGDGTKSCWVCGSVKGSDAPSQYAKPTAQAETRNDLQQQPKEDEHHPLPDIEQQRKEAEQEAEKTLDKEAIAAIDETRKAIAAIAANKNDEALAAIEQATGKVNVLLGRNPATALIPVSREVTLIDTAPRDHLAILELAQDVSRAVDNMDFPTARALLAGLMSEIRVRTYNLPLATFPSALKEAARLLNQKKNQEASNVLSTALNTLVALDRVIPIPLLAGREAIEEAQVQVQNDRAAAQRLLELAKGEVLRARELGYLGKDAEYAALNNDIAKLEKQLKGNEDLTSVFSALKEKLRTFVKRQSDRPIGQ